MTPRIHRDNARDLLIEKGFLKPTDDTDNWWLVFFGDHVEVSVDVTPKGGVTRKETFRSSFDGRTIQRVDY